MLRCKEVQLALRLICVLILFWLPGCDGAEETRKTQPVVGAIAESDVGEPKASLAKVPLASDSEVQPPPHIRYPCDSATNLATGHGNLAVVQQYRGGPDHIQIRDLRTGRIGSEFAAPGNGTKIEFSPSGELLAICCDNRLVVRNLTTNIEIVAPQQLAVAESIAFENDESRILAWCRESSSDGPTSGPSEWRLFSWTTRESKADLLFSKAFSTLRSPSYIDPESRQLIFTEFSKDGIAVHLAASDWTHPRTWTIPYAMAANIMCVTIMNDGEHAVVGTGGIRNKMTGETSSEGSVIVYSTVSAETDPVATISSDEEPWFKVSLLRHAAITDRLVVGSPDRLTVYDCTDVAHPEKVLTIRGDGFQDCQFSPDGSSLIATRDGEVLIWDL